MRVWTAQRRTAPRHRTARVVGSVVAVVALIGAVWLSGTGRATIAVALYALTLATAAAVHGADSR